MGHTGLNQPHILRDSAPALPQDEGFALGRPLLMCVSNGSLDRWASTTSSFGIGRWTEPGEGQIMAGHANPLIPHPDPLPAGKGDLRLGPFATGLPFRPGLRDAWTGIRKSEPAGMETTLHPHPEEDRQVRLEGWVSWI